MEQPIPQAPAAPPAPQPVLPPEPKKSNPLILILLVLLVFLLGAGGMYAWQNYSGLLFPKTIPLPKITPTPVPTATPSPASQIPTDWKTYNSSNMNLNFLFKYPQNWKFKETQSPQDTTIGYFYNDKIIDLPGPEDLQYYFYVTPTKGLPKVEFSKTAINGYTLYKTDKLPSRSGELSYFITNNDNNYIQLALNPYNVSNPFLGQEEVVQIFDQILSTFKFLP